MQVSEPSDNKTITAHHNMMQKQIREQFMLDEDILSAIAAIPRHKFVPENFQSLAYADMKIPLGHNEFMMTPNQEARILGALNLLPSDKILEVGTGSGYLTALLAKLCHSVISVDIHKDFIDTTSQKLSEHGLSNVRLLTADGHKGLESDVPYDVVCITGGLHFMEQSLFTQVRSHGRIFAIIGEQPTMTATVFKKLEDDQWQQLALFETNINYLQNIPKPEQFHF